MKKNTLTKYYVYGKHAALQAIRNKSRNIYKILITNENRKIIPASLLDKVNILEAREMDKILPKGTVHQNIAIETSQLHTEQLEDVDFPAKARFVILDQVSDPQNIGAVLRNAASFGIDGIIVPNDHTPPENGVIAKAASGALEHVKIYRVTNIVSAMKHLKKNGFWITGMDGSATDILDGKKLTDRACLVLGSEGAGIRRLVLENCDLLAKIDINSKMESLNVAAASAIAFYESTSSK